MRRFSLIRSADKARGRRQAMTEGRKETTEKTTSKIQALDDEALEGIVGGTGGEGSNEDPDVFSGSSSGPDWD